MEMGSHCGSTKKRIWRAASFFAEILILSGTILGVSIAIPQNASATNDMAAEVVELINEIRAENGLSELTVYVELQQVADLRASEISEYFHITGRTVLHATRHTPYLVSAHPRVRKTLRRDKDLRRLWWMLG